MKRILFVFLFVSGFAFACVCTKPLFGKSMPIQQQTPTPVRGCDDSQSKDEDKLSFEIIDSIKIYRDIAYLSPGREEKLDIYCPNSIDKKPRPGIVSIHGGGWAAGDKKDKVVSRNSLMLAQEGYVVVSVNYKLGARAWPTNLQDCKTAVQWMRVNAAKYNIDAERIGAIGGSAGGHLAAMVGLTGNNKLLDPNQPYPGVSTEVSAVVDLYGMTNIFTRRKCTKTGELTDELRYADKPPSFLGCGKDECEETWKLASPVFHVSQKSPPFLIMHGTADATIDYLQSKELAEKLREAGADYELVLIEGAPHSFGLFYSECNVKERALAFFRKHLIR